MGEGRAISGDSESPEGCLVRANGVAADREQPIILCWWGKSVKFTVLLARLVSK